MMKKYLVAVFKKYAEEGAGKPSLRGCYESQVPQSLKDKVTKAEQPKQIMNK